MTDTCGYPTAQDTPCQHTTTDDGDPDRCWVDSHNEADTGNDSPGRPSKFNDDRAQQAIEAARQSKSKAGCARAAGVDPKAIQRWEEKNPEFTTPAGETREFRHAFADARADGETVLVQGGLRNDNVDTSMAKFLLSTSFDYIETEKREIMGEDGGPVKVDSDVVTVTQSTDE